MTEKDIHILTALTPKAIEEVATTFLKQGEEGTNCLYIGWNRGIHSRLLYRPALASQLWTAESPEQLWRQLPDNGNGLLATRELVKARRLVMVNLDHPEFNKWQEVQETQESKATLKTVNILGLGDVGSTMALAMCLYGQGVIGEIGIYDISPERQQRWEMELNQIAEPLADNLPKVRIIQANELFHCDLFAFTASVGVPPLSVKSGDVRAVQFEGNAKLIDTFIKQAVEEGYQGVFAVVSDPVDQLCRYAYEAGLKHSSALNQPVMPPERFKGFGLGVMNGRATYFAKQLGHRFEETGRVYGPHGQGLVVANDYREGYYDQSLSLELTEKTITANLAMRELGHKPYVAPAVASGAIGIIRALLGKWHYSCVSFNGFYYGCLNRCTQGEIEVESLDLPENLKERIRHSVQQQEAQWQSFW